MNRIRRVIHTAAVIGHMSVTASKHGSLVGKIAHSGHTYPIVFRQISTR
jgi:hypothetical protein